MGLRCPCHQAATDLGHGLRDLEPAPQQVDTTDPERGQLAVPQAVVGQDQDDEPVLSRGIGKLSHLLVREEPLLDFPRSHQPHTLGWVPHDPAVTDGQCQHQGERPVRLTDA